MKKYVALLCAILILVSMVGCGAEKELKPIERVQASLVEIGQQYLDGKMSKSETLERLYSIKVPKTAGDGEETMRIDLMSLTLLVELDCSYESIDETIDRIESTDYLTVSQDSPAVNNEPAVPNTEPAVPMTEPASCN